MWLLWPHRHPNPVLSENHFQPLQFVICKMASGAKAFDPCAKAWNVWLSKEPRGSPRRVYHTFWLNRLLLPPSNSPCWHQWHSLVRLVPAPAARYEGLILTRGTRFCLRRAGAFCSTRAPTCSSIDRKKCPHLQFCGCHKYLFLFGFS